MNLTAICKHGFPLICELTWDESDPFKQVITIIACRGCHDDGTVKKLAAETEAKIMQQLFRIHLARLPTPDEAQSLPVVTKSGDSGADQEELEGTTDDRSPHGRYGPHPFERRESNGHKCQGDRGAVDTLRE